MVLAPDALLAELRELEERGVPARERLRVSPACPLILPYHGRLIRPGGGGEREDRDDRARHRSGLRGQGRAPRPAHR